MRNNVTGMAKGYGESRNLLAGLQSSMQYGRGERLPGTVAIRMYTLPVWPSGRVLHCGQYLGTSAESVLAVES
jgi:hypothetical protein